MPTSLKLQEEYGADLQVIFVESQGANRDRMEGFALRRKWLGTNAMWTTERPLSMSSRGLPKYTLIGADGTVIEQGRHTTSKTSKLIEAEIKSSRRAPAGTPKELRPAWQSYAKGDVGKALLAASKVRDKGHMVEQADAAIATFQRRSKAKLDEVRWCLTNGYLLEASDKLEGLLQEFEGAQALHARALAMSESLSNPELKPEFDACKKLNRILDKLHADGFGKRDANKQALVKLIKSSAGSLAAKRAEHLLSL